GEFRRAYRMYQRVDDRFKQDLAAPGLFAGAAHQARLHYRSFAHDNEQASANVQQALKPRIVKWQGGGYGDDVVARGALVAQRIRIQYFRTPNPEGGQISAGARGEFRVQLQGAHR